MSDECTTCHPDADCIDNNCECRFGFLGSGQFCVPLGGKCSLETAAKCSPNARCMELLGAKHICTCNEGYEGDGVTCDLKVEKKLCFNPFIFLFILITKF